MKMKIIRRIIFLKLKVLIFILWKIRLDNLISKLLTYIIIRQNKEEINKIKNQKVILAMQRGIFNLDIAALKKYPSEYKIIIYPALCRALIFDEAEWIHPKEILEQTVFYAKKEQYKKHYERLSNLFLKIINNFEKKTDSNVKLILTGNMDYFQDYPWIKTIHDHKGKFIVLEKESIVYLYTDKTNLSKRHNKYKFKYEGDYVLFYNYLAKETYIEAGSINPKQAIVTGCPRVDRLTELSKNKKQIKNYIALIASFMQPYYFATNVWDEIITDINQDEILQGKTIVKCKDKKEQEQLNNKYPKIKTVSDSIENHLRTNPSIFVGYNSTTCYDALITATPMVIPYWGETKKKSDDGLVGMHTSQFHLIANNKDEMIKILKDYIKGDTKKYMQTPTIWDNKELKEFLEKRYSRVDGKNCQRFFEFCERIIDEN